MRFPNEQLRECGGEHVSHAVDVVEPMGVDALWAPEYAYARSMIEGLTRFWIEFDYSDQNEPPVETCIGVGVTAIDRRDALQLVAHRVFSDGRLPPVKEIRVDVDVSLLDQGQVLPNMGPTHVRGIWFPLGC